MAQPITWTQSWSWSEPSGFELSWVAGKHVLSKGPEGSRQPPRPRLGRSSPVSRSEELSPLPQSPPTRWCPEQQRDLLRLTRLSPVLGV